MRQAKSAGSHTDAGAEPKRAGPKTGLEHKMAISDIPILAMLRTRLQWQQQRQQVLSQNVANSDTPNFRPMDLDEPKMDQAALSLPPVHLARTNAGHISGFAGDSTFRGEHYQFQIRPAGNAVNLEDEMLKVASNQMEYQAASQLYTHSIGLIKTASK
jgi:flagellar basal-body rod protein FlgB